MSTERPSPATSTTSTPTDPTTGTRPRAAVVVSCLALFSDMFIYGLAIPVLPLLPATVSAGPAATGGLFAAYALAMIAATPVAGRLVDRFGPRLPLLIGLVGIGVATLLFALGGPFSLLLLARVLQGLAASMSWIASLSLIAAVTPPETRGRSIGLAMSMVSIGVLLGPPLAGVLVDVLGVRAPFLAAAGLAIADGALRVVLVRSAPPSTDDFAGPVTVLRVPGTASVVTAILIGAGTLAAVEPVLPLQLAQVHRLGPLGIGSLFALLVVTGAILNPVVGAMVGRLSARNLIAAGAATAGAGLFVVAVATSTWGAAVGMVLLGASNALLLAPATILIGYQGMRADPPTMGAAYAAFNLAYAGGLFLGPVLGGAATGIAGFAAALVLIGALTVVAGFLGAIRIPHGDDETRPDCLQVSRGRR